MAILSTDHILTLEEQVEVFDMVEVFDKLITDEIYERAASYEIEEDEESYVTTVKIYDEDDNVLVSVDVPDYDMALEILDDIFEVEAQEDEDILEDE